MPEQMRMPFGKYKGKTLRWIANNDVLYLDWLYDLPDLREPLKGEVEDLCEEYSDAIDNALRDQDECDDAVRPAFDDEWSNL